MKFCACGAPLPSRKGYCSDRCHIRHNSTPDAKGCWQWDGALKDQKTYGRVTWTGSGGRRVVGAHQLSFTAFVGPVPRGHVVRHTCHNPRCVNPDHLVVGTQRDNIRDAKERGTLRLGHVMKGEDSPHSKLTADQVREIRADTRSQVTIASAYGISQSTISAIRLRRKWKHIE
jgi:hypothetical protein